MSCMCGGCARCLRDQGYEPCPHCGAFMGCDCYEEPPTLDIRHELALEEDEARDYWLERDKK